MDTKTPPTSLGGFLAGILGAASSDDCDCPNCGPREKMLLTGYALETVRAFEAEHADLKAQRDAITAQMDAAAKQMWKRVQAATGWTGKRLKIDTDHIDLGVAVLSRPKPVSSPDDGPVQFAPEATDALRNLIVDAVPFIEFHAGAEGDEAEKAEALMEKLRTLGIVVDPVIEPVPDPAAAA